MSAEIRKLNEERGRAVHEMRSLLDKAKSENNRSLTTEEQQQYDKMFARQNELRESIERETKQAELEHELRVNGSLSGAGFEKGNERAGSEGEEKADKQIMAFRSFLRKGIQGMTPEEQRALSAGSATEGGVLVAPTQWVTDLLKAMDNMVFIRAKATKFTVPKAVSLGIPTIEADPSDAEWTSEVGTGSDDDTMSFGQRELNPNALAKRIKISNKLIRSAVQNVESIVMDRLAYKFAVTEEKHFLTGNGANQPLGLFTAHASGIGTGRDIAGTNTTTAIVADTLFDVKYALKEQYQGMAEWLFHRDAVKNISKLKDSQNQYLWQPGLVAGQPDRLLNRPVNMSEYVPNTFTTGLYVGMFGVFSYYHIVDALDMTVQKLNELYAESNKTGFIGRKEVDGAPVLQEAFARMKLG